MAGGSFCFNEFSSLSGNNQRTDSELGGFLPRQFNSCFIKSIGSYQEEKHLWLELDKNPEIPCAGEKNKEDVETKVSAPVLIYLFIDYSFI